MSEVVAKVWGELMQSACDKQLTDKERAAFILGHLNYQVCNGGFDQWVGNRYAALEGAEILWILTTNPEFPVFSAVAELIKQVLPYVNLSACHGYDYLINGTEDEFWEIEDSLSKQFYAVNDEFLAAVEAFLSKESK